MTARRVLVDLESAVALLAWLLVFGAGCLVGLPVVWVLARVAARRSVSAARKGPDLCITDRGQQPHL